MKREIIVFDISDFNIGICFGFRASDFEFPAPSGA